MNTEEVTRARKRHFMISIARFCGAVLLTVGLAVIANGFMRLPIEAGYLMFAVGIFVFIGLPVILSRRWKMPK